MAAGLAVVLATGCQIGSGSDRPPPAAPATIAIVPADQARSIVPADKVSITADGGVLTEVAVTDPGGEPVKGRFNEAKTSWRNNFPLDFGTRYSVVATATNADGAPTTSRSTFTTVRPKAMLHTAVVPLNGETVGVGLPIQVQLSDPVSDRAAVEERLTVVSDPQVEGAWHWISDDKLRYRPKEYWPSGTEVTLKVRLQGIDAGDGVFGDEHRDVSFTIGRDIRSLVDVDRLRMTVTIDGKRARTIPITAGKKGWETRNGIKVALEKHKLKVMDAATVGIDPDDPDYYRLNVRWAIRVTWSGEFVHGAEWSTAAQGRSRVSHGCVGMSLANAEWFFDRTQRGDIIEVVNSPTDRDMELDNGFGDWNLTWSEWTEGSALAED
ncbi:MAG: Ig-like domain-containing protein [Sporichthyaceae bacterium]|nr:Ig-like domain-containing protein [Sporichthyaceae bacterium]